MHAIFHTLQNHWVTKYEAKIKSAVISFSLVWYIRWMYRGPKLVFTLIQNRHTIWHTHKHTPTLARIDSITMATYHRIGEGQKILIALMTCEQILFNYSLNCRTLGSSVYAYMCLVLFLPVQSPLSCFRSFLTCFVDFVQLFLRH